MMSYTNDFSSFFDTHLGNVEKKRLKERIKNILASFGNQHLYLAYHSAFPISITPNLLYKIWSIFRYDISGNPLHIPWVAVADLLFSGLFEEVGYEVYSMNNYLRIFFLEQLRKDPNFGEIRIKELSQFILDEYQRYIYSPDIDIRDQAFAQRWNALGYIDNNLLVQELASFLQKLNIEDASEWARIRSLIEKFQNTDIKDNLHSLLLYVRGMYCWVCNDYEQSRLFFEHLNIINNQFIIGGVLLSIPTKKILISRENLQTIAIEEFNYRTIFLKKRGNIFKQSWGKNIFKKKAECFHEDLNCGLNLEMVFIPEGEMLSRSKGSLDINDDKQNQNLNFKPFFMSKYTITQKQWSIVADLPKVSIDIEPYPSLFLGPHRPVENISWYEAIEFCQRLHSLTGKTYTLPSEAEWEYSCCAQNYSEYHYGETINSKYANISDIFIRNETTVVGLFKYANPFGLYDMHGNVWEWCYDSYQDDYEEKDSNLSIEHYFQLKVAKGGGWDSTKEDCLSSNSKGFDSNAKQNNLGFRVKLYVELIP